MAQSRPLEKRDFPLIYKTIREQQWRRYEEWTALIDPERVRQACFGEHPHIKAVVLLDCYLFLYQVVVPWYSTKRVMEECLLLRIKSDPLYSLRAVFNAVKKLAIQNQCYMVTMGTAMANDVAYGRMLERNGFKQQLRGYAFNLPNPTSVNSNELHR